MSLPTGADGYRDYSRLRIHDGDTDVITERNAAYINANHSVNAVLALIQASGASGSTERSLVSSLLTSAGLYTGSTEPTGFARVLNYIMYRLRYPGTVGAIKDTRFASFSGGLRTRQWYQLSSGWGHYWLFYNSGRQASLFLWEGTVDNAGRTDAANQGTFGGTPTVFTRRVDVYMKANNYAWLMDSSQGSFQRLGQDLDVPDGVSGLLTQNQVGDILNTSNINPNNPLTWQGQDIKDVTAAVNQNITINLRTATGGTAPITYSVRGAPSWLTYNSGANTLTGRAVAGESSITFVARSADGQEVTDSFRVTVGAATNPDYTAPRYSFGVTIGQAVSVRLPIATRGSETIVYTHTGDLPPGLTIAGGILSGTVPLGTTPANYHIIWTATASGGGVANVPITIRVSPSVPSPSGDPIEGIWTAIPDYATLEGVTWLGEDFQKLVLANLQYLKDTLDARS